MADEKATETHETPDGGTETTTTNGEAKDENLITEEKTATTEANQI